MSIGIDYPDVQTSSKAINNVLKSVTQNFQSYMLRLQILNFYADHMWNSEIKLRKSEVEVHQQQLYNFDTS